MEKNSPAREVRRIASEKPDAASFRSLFPNGGAIHPLDLIHNACTPFLGNFPKPLTAERRSRRSPFSLLGLVGPNSERTTSLQPSLHQPRRKITR